MTGRAVTSNETVSELRTILEANSNWSVVFGAASPGQGLVTGGKFLACWPITPARTGEGLASEDGGQIQRVWQINCFGPDMATAVAMSEELTDRIVFPAGWELVTVGACIIDTAPAPLGYFVPVDYKHTRMPD